MTDLSLEPDLLPVNECFSIRYAFHTATVEGKRSFSQSVSIAWSSSEIA